MADWYRELNESLLREVKVVLKDVLASKPQEAFISSRTISIVYNHAIGQETELNVTILINLPNCVRYALKM